MAIFFTFIPLPLLELKVTGCLSVCECVDKDPFTVKILNGPGKVNNYFRGGYHHPPNRN